MAVKTFHGYSSPWWGPTWETAYLVYQAGIPRARTASLTGGGQIYGHEFAGPFTPLYITNTPGVLSITGGGQILGLPPSLAGLFGGNRGLGS